MPKLISIPDLKKIKKIANQSDDLSPILLTLSESFGKFGETLSVRIEGIRSELHYLIRSVRNLEGISDKTEDRIKRLAIEQENLEGSFKSELGQIDIENVLKEQGEINSRIINISERADKLSEQLSQKTDKQDNVKVTLSIYDEIKNLKDEIEKITNELKEINDRLEGVKKDTRSVLEGRNAGYITAPAPSLLWKKSDSLLEPRNSENARVPRLEVDDSSTYIDKDGTGNMTFTDSQSGTQTLASLMGGGVEGPDTSTDNGIVLWDGADGDTVKDIGFTITNDGTKTTILGISGDYNRIGDAGTTGHNLNSEDDWMVTGDAEVDGTLYLDGTSNSLIAAGYIVLANNYGLNLGSTGAVGIGTLKAITSDANANLLELAFVSPGAVKVPVLAVAQQSIGDSGLFDGLTQPIIAPIEKNNKYASASDATSSGADTTLTVDGNEFTNAVVGDIVRVTAGTNATAGWYWINTVTDANNVVLDRNWCTDIVSGGTFVAYHSFTVLSAEGICTSITDGAPDDSSVEIDRDGWILCDVGNNKLYFRSQSAWQPIEAGADVTANNTCDTPGGAGTDTTAIHDNTANEISAIAEKGAPASADILVIEDSEASYVKKKVQITNLPGGADADAIHDNVANEISAIAEKETPASADILVIEDSAASYVKKKVQITNLPSGSHTLDGGQSDVTITDVGDNEVLAYDNGSSTWINQTASEAGLATNSHHDTHLPSGSDPLTTAAAGTISPDDSAAVGTAESFARSDHVHEITCDTPNELAGVQAGAEGSAYYFARSDHDHQIQHSIADNHIVTIDDTDAAANDYAKFTANGISGRSYSEVLSDLSAQADATFDWNSQSLDNVNVLSVTTINAHGLGGKLTAGANEIEGSDFDIDGGDISAVTISGGLTWSAAQNLNSQALTNVNIDSGDISAATISGGLTWNAAQDLNSQALTNVDINSGSIDGVTIGAASAPTVTNLGTVTTCDINGGTIGGVTLDGEITLGEVAIVLDSALSADGKWSGIARDEVLGYTASFGELMYLSNSDGRWEKADADAEATAGDVQLGICLETGNDGDTRLVLLYGYVREDDWNFTSPGDALYADEGTGGTAGAMTATRPSGSGDIVRVVGYQTNQADTIFFNPTGSWVELA